MGDSGRLPLGGAGFVFGGDTNRRSAVGYLFGTDTVMLR